MIWKPGIVLVLCVYGTSAGIFDRIFGRCSDDEVMKSPAIDIEVSCLEAADAGSCSFYDCFERRYPCDGCGFSKEYGTYNCEKFHLPAYYNRFNDAGKRWVNATGQCLLRVLKGIYQQETASCRMIKQTMIDHVSTCYLENGVVSFCDIFWDNKDVLYGVYEARNFVKSKTVLGEVLQIAGSCTGSRLSEFGGQFEQHINTLFGHVRDAFSSVSNWFRNKFREITPIHGK